MGFDRSHYFQIYLRDLVGATVLYYTINGLWHTYIYHIQGEKFFAGFEKPSANVIKDQILLAQSSLFVYASLPCLSDFLFAGGYTKGYYHIDEIGGLGNYIMYTLLYFSLVEIGIYWMKTIILSYIGTCTATSLAALRIRYWI